MNRRTVNTKLGEKRREINKVCGNRRNCRALKVPVVNANDSLGASTKNGEHGEKSTLRDTNTRLGKKRTREGGLHIRHRRTLAQ